MPHIVLILSFTFSSALAVPTSYAIEEYKDYTTIRRLSSKGRIAITAVPELDNVVQPLTQPSDILDTPQIQSLANAFKQTTTLLTFISIITGVVLGKVKIKDWIREWS